MQILTRGVIHADGASVVADVTHLARGEVQQAEQQQGG